MAAKPTKPKSQRNKTPAQIEAEKKRLAEARRADAERAKRDEEDQEKDEDERDDEMDEERDGDEGKKDDDAESDDERDGDDEDERDGDDEDEGESKEDERSAAAAAAARRAAQAAVKAERVRSAKITEMAERAGMTKLGRKHLDQGTSVKRFGEIVLERMLKSQEARGNDTLAGNGTEEVGRDVARSGSKASFQREVEEGAAFFRRVSGKPDPKKN